MTLATSHNFSLVHDDLMDRDRRRRHRATVWAMWSDATVAAANRSLIRGRAADMALETRDNVSLAECLSMSWGKTAALIAASMVAGAQLAGAPPPLQDALNSYGSHLGIAFRLVDDLLGIWDQPEVSGKRVYSDLRSRKKTLPIAWALHNGRVPGRELATWLANTPHTAAATNDGLRYIATLIARGGGRDWARQETDRRVTLAIETIERASFPPGPAEQLQTFAHDLATRTPK